MGSDGKIARAYDLVDQALKLLIESDTEDALEGPVWEAIRATDNAGVAISRLLAMLGEGGD